jgi:hypothetical protein
MKFTRAIALCALTLAIALAIGAIAPMQPYASAGNLQPIFSSAPEHAQPTPALATAEPTTVPPPAAPVIAQLPQPTPQVIYIQLPPVPPPQVIYVEQLPAAQVEQLPAAQVEQPPAAQVEQLAEISAEIPAASAGDTYQQRRLDAINSGAAYRPRTR